MVQTMVVYALLNTNICSYMLEDCNLSLILECINVFVTKDSLKFVDEFVEIGGILTVVEVLNLSFATDASF